MPKPYNGTLVGFSRDSIEVLGFIEILIMFTTDIGKKSIPAKLLVVEGTSAYNMIVGRPILSGLGATISTLRLAMKLPIENMKITTMYAN